MALQLVNVPLHVQLNVEATGQPQVLLTISAIYRFLLFVLTFGFGFEKTFSVWNLPNT